MQLIYKTFYNHIDSGMSMRYLVSAELQTEVAKKIGEKNLIQLESEYRDGVRIVRLLKGLGRVFELLAKGVGVAIAERVGDFFEGHIAVEHHGFCGVDAKLNAILLKRASEHAAKLLAK